MSRFCLSDADILAGGTREATHIMDISVDIWLRGDNHASTAVIASVPREPRAWTDTDVALVLEGMLRALERAKHPQAASDRPVSLRGFSWIVSPFETGGVVIALELTLGAVVAGPFDVAEGDLTARIERVMGAQRAHSSTIH
jgi:hypothetical protein